MQTRGTIVRTAAILIILFLFAQLLSLSIFGELRRAAYQVFLKSARSYLSFQTRDFASLEGQTFVVKYTEKDREIAPHVLEAAQNYYDLLKEKLGFGLSETGKRLVVIYPDKGSLSRSISRKGDQRAVGVYWAGSIRLLSPQEWLDSSGGPELTEVFLRENPITHELTHMLVDYQTGGNYTRWLTEGLAQYMEEAITGYTLPEPDPRPQVLLSLAEIERAFDDPLTQLQAYWQARLIMDYLVREEGMGKIGRLLDLLRAGGEWEESFQEVYGFPPESLTTPGLIVQ